MDLAKNLNLNFRNSIYLKLLRVQIVDSIEAFARVFFIELFSSCAESS